MGGAQAQIYQLQGVASALPSIMLFRKEGIGNTWTGGCCPGARALQLLMGTLQALIAEQLKSMQALPELTYTAVILGTVYQEKLSMINFVLCSR